MADNKKTQRETVAKIDAAKAIDTIFAIMEMMESSSSLTFAWAENPMEYLLQLLKAVGITEDKIKDFLTYILLGALPGIELSVKAILLSNLKNLISCSVDPRIPEQYRKKKVSPGNPDSAQLNGIDINIESIDFLSKLKVSPLSEAGKKYYFGLEGVKTVYPFARADDMDAFLWFVKNKGKFPQATKITGDVETQFLDGIHGVDATGVNPENPSLFTAFEASYSSDKSSKILPGNTFTYDGSSYIVSMCFESLYDEKDKIINNTILPTSDDKTSVNWYIRRADQLGKNIGFGWNSKKAKSNTKSGRDFSKERAICNIQYIQSMPDEAPLTGLVDDKFRFTILPKPYIHVPVVSHGEAPWNFQKILFNDKGELDLNGRLSLAGSPTEFYDEESKAVYITGGTGDNEYRLKLDPKTGKITSETPKGTMLKNIQECYPGLTVYEFNYDYVMGMKLFDAKVIASILFDSLMDTKLGIGLTVSFDHEDAREEIREIVKEIVQSDDSEISDCMFTFDNTKYIALMKAAEEKRAHKTTNAAKNRSEELNNILNEYDENATLNEQKTVLSRAISHAALTVSEGADEKDRPNIEFSFISDLVQNLVEAIIYSLLSPKVMMLLEVNEKIMGGKWEKFTMKDVLKSMSSIIVAVSKEIRDLILEELLKLLFEQLQPIIETLSSILAREQIEDYTEAINQLINNCPFMWFNFGTQQEETKLDTVDYADIDTSINITGNKPLNC